MIDGNPDNYIPHSIKNDNIIENDSKKNKNINNLSINDNNEDYVCVFENEGIEYPEEALGLIYRISRSKEEKMSRCKKKGFSGEEQNLYIRRDDWIDPDKNIYECGLFNKSDDSRVKYTKNSGQISDRKLPSKMLCDYYSNNPNFNVYSKMVRQDYKDPVVNLRVFEMDDEKKNNAKSKIFWITYLTIVMFNIFWTNFYHVKKPHYFYDFIDKYFVKKISIIIIIFGLFIYLFCPFNTCYHGLDTPLYRRDFNKFVKNNFCKYSNNNTAFLEESIYYKFDNSNKFKKNINYLNYILNLNRKIRNKVTGINYKLCNICETNFKCIDFNEYNTLKLYKPEIIEVTQDNINNYLNNNNIRLNSYEEIINKMYKYKKINTLFKNIDFLNGNRIIITDSKNKIAKINNIKFNYLYLFGIFNFPININSNLWSIKISDNENGPFNNIKNNDNLSSRYIEIRYTIYKIIFKNSILDNNKSFYYGPYDTGSIIRLKTNNNSNNELYMCCLTNDKIFFNLLKKLALNGDLKDYYLDKEGQIFKGFNLEDKKVILKFDFLKDKKNIKYIDGGTRLIVTRINNKGELERIKLDVDFSIYNDDKYPEFVSTIDSKFKNKYENVINSNNFTYKWIQLKDRKGVFKYNSDLNNLYIKKCQYSHRIFSVDNNYDLLGYNIEISLNNFITFFKSNTLDYMDNFYYPSFYLEDLKKDLTFNKLNNFIKRKLIKIYKYLVEFPGYKFRLNNYSIVNNDLLVYNNFIPNKNNISIKLNINKLNNYFIYLNKLILKLNEFNDYYNDDESDIEYLKYYNENLNEENKIDLKNYKNNKLYNKFDYKIDNNLLKYEEINDDNLNKFMSNLYISFLNLNYVQRDKIRENINYQLINEYHKLKNKNIELLKIYQKNFNKPIYKHIYNLNDNSKDVKYYEILFLKEYVNNHDFIENRYLKDGILIECKKCKQKCKINF